MKYGSCLWTLPGTFEEKITLLEKLQFQGVTIEFMGSITNDWLCEKANREYVNVQLAKYNLELVALAANVLCQYGMSKKEYENEVKIILDEILEVAIEMGVKHIHLPALLAGAITTEDELLQTVKWLSYICDKAESNSIQIGLESVIGSEEMKKILNLVNCNNLYIVYDGGNIASAKIADPLQVLLEMYGKIGMMHMKDKYEADISKPLQFGEGDSKVTDICSVLKENGYDDWIMLESRYMVFENHAEILKTDLAIMHQLVG